MNALLTSLNRLVWEPAFDGKRLVFTGVDPNNASLRIGELSEEGLAVSSPGYDPYTLRTEKLRVWAHTLYAELREDFEAQVLGRALDPPAPAQEVPKGFLTPFVRALIRAYYLAAPSPVAARAGLKDLLVTYEVPVEAAAEVMAMVNEAL